jgi:hypothetical protein
MVAESYSALSEIVAESYSAMSEIVAESYSAMSEIVAESYSALSEMVAESYSVLSETALEFFEGFLGGLCSAHSETVQSDKFQITRCFRNRIRKYFRVLIKDRGGS